MFCLCILVILMKNKTFQIILIVILIIFICSYYISNSGYYEYHMQSKTILTNEKIKEFEEDVKNNENIDIKTYLNNEELDYSNKITNLMYNISNSGNKITRKCIQALFKKLGSLVED